MFYRLPAHLHLARVADAVILLDTAADRYRRLTGEPARLLPMLAAGETADSSALAPLLDAGLVIASPEPSHVRFTAASRPTSSALEQDGAVHEVGAITAGTALVGARLSLAARGLSATLRSVRKLAGHPATHPPAHSAAYARGFARARAAIPLARRCLPDAFSLFSLLRRRGCPAELVLGVRDGPFAAHAWVECGDIVLSDTLAAVGEYVPILRL